MILYYNRGGCKIVVQTKNISKNLVFKANPDEIYEAWMDSKKHTKFTESKANFFFSKLFSILTVTVLFEYLNCISMRLNNNDKIKKNWCALFG